MTASINDRITHALSRASGFWLGAYLLSTAFVTYFCMYAFRKPFTAATYELVQGWSFSIDFKVVLVISQVFGYTLSKIIGIKVVSEAGDRNRGALIFGLIAAAQLALVLFAFLPPNLMPLALFLNGLPLGMIWGLVFRYLEGRRMSEFLGAGLCTSFIVSSGFVKSVGRALIVDHGVPEAWMPAATGALFFPVLAVAVYFLSLSPKPDDRDQLERVSRKPMLKEDRRNFSAMHGMGLALLVITFVALSAIRDFRDNFAVDIWKAVGHADAPAVYTLSEIPAAVLVLVLLGGTMMVRNNRMAVFVIFSMMCLGVLLMAGSTLLFELGQIGPITWMILLGAGVYVGYVPCTSILADRLIASLRVSGNSGFIVYVLDAWGYAGAVGVLLFKEIGASDLSWLSFFVGLCYIAAGVAFISTAGALVYFHRKSAPPAASPRLQPDAAAA